MALQYLVEQHKDHLLLVFEGTYEPRSVNEFVVVVVHLLRERRPRRVLCDFRRASGDLNLVDRFNMGFKFAEEFRNSKLLADLHDFRMAVLGNQPLIHPEGFGAKVARNRGVEVIATTDPQEAYDWLGIDPEKPTTPPG